MLLELGSVLPPLESKFIDGATILKSSLKRILVDTDMLVISIAFLLVKAKCFSDISQRRRIELASGLIALFNVRNTHLICFVLFPKVYLLAESTRQ